MTDIIGQGVIKVVADATDLKAGMAQARQAVEGFERAAAASGAAAGNSMSKGMGQVGSATDSLTSSQRRYLSGLERQAIQIGKTRSEYARWRADMLGVTSQAEPMIQRLADAEKVTLNYGNSLKQTTAAMRLLPAQITDIVTSLASGQPAYLVAIQQGGQIKDSFGGVGAAFKVLAGLITPVKAAFFGLGAVLTGLAVAYKQGSDESQRLANALVMSGGAAGVTAERLGEMAARVGAIVGTQKQASDAIAQMAETGKITGTSFEALGRAAVAMNLATGKAVQDTVKEFLELSKTPTESIKKLNDQYHFLTRAVYEQIRSLEEQGRVSEAADVAQREYARSMETRAAAVIQNLGFIEGAWKSIASFARDAWDAMLGVGRAEGLAGQLNKARTAISQLQAQYDTESGEGRVSDSTQRELGLAQEHLSVLEAHQRELDVFARKQGQTIENNDKAIRQSDALLRWQQQYGSNQEKITRETKIWEAELGRALTTAEKAQIAAKFKDAKGPANTDDAGTRMLERIRETEAILRQQIQTQREIGAEEKKRLAFETQIAELKNKAKLTKDDKSILRDEAKIRAGFDVSVELEQQLSIRERNEKKEKEVYDVMQKQAALVEKRNDDFARADAAAQKYLDTLNRGYEREREGFTMGRRERDRLAGRSQIEEKYAQQKLQLESDALSSDMTEEIYSNRLKIIEGFQARALAGWELHYSRRMAQEENATAGMIKGLNEYADSAASAAESTSQAFQSAFTGLENIILTGGGDDGGKGQLREELRRLEERKEGILGGNYEQDKKDEMVAQIDDKIAQVRDRLKTARSEFQQLIESFQKDIARMFLRQQVMGPFAQWLSGVLGGNAAYNIPLGGGNSAGMPAGAPFATGTNYVPYDGFQATLHKGEAVIPAAYNPAAGGGGTLVQNIHFNGSDSGGPNPDRVARMVGEVAMSRFDESRRRRPGG